jgi:hypothetical protein
VEPQLDSIQLFHLYRKLFKQCYKFQSSEEAAIYLTLLDYLLNNVDLSVKPFIGDFAK